MVQKTILIVDDEASIRKALRSGLEAEGWRVLEAQDSTSLFDVLQHEEVDLITLDLVLGDEDGLDIARRLRTTRNLPILMISGKTEPYDRVHGLECGADDYITKPFHIREVLLRIERTLERYTHEISGGEEVVFDHSAFDLQRKVVRHIDGSPLELTGIELRLLELFVRHPGRVLSRDDISQALHGREWSPYDRTIDGHVARLRRKIEPPGEAPTLIRSVRGVGYVFTGEVHPATQTTSAPAQRTDQGT